MWFILECFYLYTNLIGNGKKLDLNIVTKKLRKPTTIFGSWFPLLLYYFWQGNVLWPALHLVVFLLKSKNHIFLHPYTYKQCTARLCTVQCTIFFFSNRFLRPQRKAKIEVCSWIVTKITLGLDCWLWQTSSHMCTRSKVFIKCPVLLNVLVWNFY